MKGVSFFCLLMSFLTLPFLLLAGPPKKKVTVTSTSLPKDDPNKIYTFCSKWGTRDSLWVMFDNSCPNYTLTSYSLQAGLPANPYVNITPQTTLPYTYTGVSNEDSVLLQLDFQSLTSLPNTLASSQFILLNLFLTPDNNAEIPCSRTKITVHFYLSEAGCAKIDSMFTTGECYSCKTNGFSNVLTPVKYNQFVANMNSNTVSLSSLAQGFTPQDTTVWFLGDGDSCTIINQQIISSLSYGNYSLQGSQLIHTYSNTGTYTIESKIKCYQQKKCVYRAYSSVTVHTVLPVIDIFASYELQGKNVKLRWFSNLMNKELQYKIIKSTNQQDWQEIGLTTDNIFEEKGLNYGVCYYQIIALDINQTELGRSAIQVVEISFLLSLSPNPCKDFLTLELAEEAAAQASVSVINMQGNVCMYFAQAPSIINVTHLTSGIYVLKVNVNGVIKVIKWVKV